MMQYFASEEKVFAAMQAGNDINGLILLAALLFIVMFLSWFLHETKQLL